MKQNTQRGPQYLASKSQRLIARKRTIATVTGASAFAALCGCALQGVVQRQTVEYNTAAAGMANQLALMNIVRAEQHLPIFYTSISRLSGSAVVTATGGLNAQLKTSSPVDTTSTSTATANTVTSTGTTNTNVVGGTSPSSTEAVATTTGPTVTKLISQAVTSGGNIYMPSVGGQVMTGPSFDINILDTQQFYQGVLAELPFSTVELFINQDVDNQLLMRLLIERIEFRLHERKDDEHPAGSLDHAIYNFPSDTAENGSAATAFMKFISCVELIGDVQNKPPKALAPVSLVALEPDGKPKPIAIRDLILFDGQKLDIAKKVGKDFDPDATIGTDMATDKDVFVVRPAAEQRLPRFQPQTCVTTQKADGTSGVQPTIDFTLSSIVGPLGELARSPRSAGTAVFRTKVPSSADPKVLEEKSVTTDIVLYFRSPEGVIKFLGKYLEQAQSHPKEVYKLKTADGYFVPLFSVGDTRGPAPLVTAEVSGKRYSIDGPKSTSEADARGPQTNMTVLALVEELVNLQKSATDRPVTVPVHVLP